MTTRYRIENKATRELLGYYKGKTGTHAIAACLRDAGYLVRVVAKPAPRVEGSPGTPECTASAVAW